MSLATIKTKFIALFKRGSENVGNVIPTRAKDYFSDWKQTLAEGSIVIRIAVGAVILLVLLTLVLGFYFSREPEVFLWQNDFNSTSILTAKPTGFLSSALAREFPKLSPVTSDFVLFPIFCLSNFQVPAGLLASDYSESISLGVKLFWNHCEKIVIASTIVK